MNWSLMLNALLLIGVFIAIFRTMQTRRQQATPNTVQHVSDHAPSSHAYDDIIAVRKVHHSTDASPAIKPSISLPARQSVKPYLKPALNLEQSAMKSHTKPVTNTTELDSQMDKNSTQTPDSQSMMVFLLAKSNRQLAGYELLQAILSAGFRFGEGGLFHRHQYPNCQGPVMCSLAAATKTGVFDLENIGGFVVHGLCLFMRISGQKALDEERFDMMLDTARTLSEGLDTHLLDECRQPLSEQSIARYHQKLILEAQAEASV